MSLHILSDFCGFQPATVGLAPAGRPKIGLPENPIHQPTLASQGIDKNLAHQARTKVLRPSIPFTIDIDRA